MSPRTLGLPSLGPRSLRFGLELAVSPAQIFGLAANVFRSVYNPEHQ